MVSAPELKKYLDRKISVHLNGSRNVVGTLRGYDVFLNITLADALDGETEIGTVVSIFSKGFLYRDTNDRLYEAIRSFLWRTNLVRR